MSKEVHFGRKGLHTVVDDADYEYVSSLGLKAQRSPLNRTTYVFAYIDGKWIKLSRLLKGVTDPKIKVDHEDHDGLNNQRDNLRLSSNTENCRNRQKTLTPCTNNGFGASDK